MSDPVRPEGAASPGPVSARGAQDDAPVSQRTTLFVSDPSAEAEKIAQTLRTAGYMVVDVPMSMLIARVAVQRPRAILIDADTEGALATAARLRELPDADDIDVVFVGKEGEALKGLEDAMAHEGSGFFPRPVDVLALVRKIAALTGGPGQDEMSRPSTPPPSLPSPRPSAANLPPASMRAAPSDRGGSSHPPSRPPPPSTVTRPESRLTSPEAISVEHRPRTASIQPPLSVELEALLAEAEQRAGVPSAGPGALPPTPEEEIEAVLPAEILSSLDEPLEEEDPDEFEGKVPQAEARSGTTGSRQITSTGRAPETSDAGDSAPETHGGPQGSATTGTRAGPSVDGTSPAMPGRGQHQAGTSPTMPGRGLNASDPVPRVTTGAEDGTPQGVSVRGPPDVDAAQERIGPRTELGGAEGVHVHGSTLGSGALASAMLTAPPDLGRDRDRSDRAKSVPPPAPMPSVMGPREAPLVLARAVALRTTGALCIESEDGIRRAVLREGDIVTAASGVDGESLLAFLGARGDLPREVVQRLTGKVPPFGRHAGAALVAHGHLRQDQLWPVLRAHAEWILGRALLVPRGTAVIEEEPPGRLKGEPSVFGGSTGAEVFIEVVRRTIAPDEAVERMGGLGARLSGGENESLLSECALDAEERDLFTRMRGSTLGELVAASSEQDVAAVAYGLALLGVLDVLQALRGADADDGAGKVDHLDEDAVRARVRARLELVDEADYFALLGIGKDATGYEVRRAFLELRRAFDPARLLTPQIADLADDVRKIAVVLEEAYEILRDNARRERYRRAISASPR